MPSASHAAANSEPIDAAALHHELRSAVGAGSGKGAGTLDCPRYSACCGRSGQAFASALRNVSFASPTHRPGSGVNQSSCRSQSWRLQARIIEDFRFAVGWHVLVALPFVAVPLPGASGLFRWSRAAATAPFRRSVRKRIAGPGMNDTELLPIRAVFGMRAAQMREETVAQLRYRK